MSASERWKAKKKGGVDKVNKVRMLVVNSIKSTGHDIDVTVHVYNTQYGVTFYVYMYVVKISGCCHVTQHTIAGPICYTSHSCLIL